MLILSSKPSVYYEIWTSAIFVGTFFSFLVIIYLTLANRFCNYYQISIWQGNSLPLWGNSLEWKLDVIPSLLPLPMTLPLWGNSLEWKLGLRPHEIFKSTFLSLYGGTHLNGNWMTNLTSDNVHTSPSPFMGELTWMETIPYTLVEYPLLEPSLPLWGNSLEWKHTLEGEDYLSSAYSPFMGELTWMETTLNWLVFKMLDIELSLYGGTHLNGNESTR
jgi:hypothetical protein